MTSAMVTEIDIGGKKYILTSDDTYLQAAQNGFEPEMVRLFKAVAAGSKVILDIGANLGCTTLLFSDMAERVVAFEPSRGTFGFLEKNIARAGKRNVTLQNIGLGAEAGEFPLTVLASNRACSFVSNQTAADGSHAVETIVVRPLDQVVADLPLAAIDFLKIDVEGFEGQVLRGGKNTLATHKPTVVLELNHWCLNAFQRTSVPDFFDLLRSIFPILLAVDGACYMDLNNKDECYSVMYNHIMHLRFCNIVAGFDESRLARFRSEYQHRLEAETAAKPVAPVAAAVPAAPTAPPAAKRSLPVRIARRLKSTWNHLLHGS